MTLTDPTFEKMLARRRRARARLQAAFKRRGVDPHSLAWPHGYFVKDQYYLTFQGLRTLWRHLYPKQQRRS